MIIAVPAECPETTPLLTVATLVLLDDHITEPEPPVVDASRVVLDPTPTFVEVLFSVTVAAEVIETVQLLIMPE